MLDRRSITERQGDAAGAVMSEMCCDTGTMSAQMRRDAMRMRLIESAVICYAMHGLGGVVIGDVIRLAAVSRGSFYNHFDSYESLLSAACAELRSEVLEQAFTATMTAEQALGGARGAGTRIAVAGFSVMALAWRYPVLGRFVSVLGVSFDAPQLDFGRAFLLSLEQGLEQGELQAANSALAWDYLQGSLIQAMTRLSHMAIDHGDWAQGQTYARAMIEILLRGLGVAPLAAHDLAQCAIPVPHPRQDGLLVKAHRAFCAQLPPTKRGDAPKPATVDPNERA